MYWPGWRQVKHASGIRLRPFGSTNFALKPAFERMRYECAYALDLVWQQGGWCLYVDETYFLGDYLKLDRYLVRLLTQGRSNRISVVCGVQRPSRVSRFALSEPTHVLCARLGDKRDIATMADAIGDDYAQKLAEIPRYQFAYVDKASGKMALVDRDSVLGVLNGR